MKTIIIVLFFLGLLFSVKFFYLNFLSNIILLDKKIIIILIFISFALVLSPFLNNIDVQKSDLFEEKTIIDIGKFLSFEIILIFIVVTIFQIFITWDSAFVLKIINSK